MRLETTAFPGLGRALRKLRESRGHSVTEWARRLGLAQSTVSKYEAGGLGVPLDVIHSIAKEIKQPTDVVLVYLLKDRFPRLASVDYELGALVDEFAAKLNL